MGPVTMLPHVGALPRTEIAASVRNRNVETGLGQYAAHVGGHVVGAFRSVGVARIAIGREPRHEGLEIA